MCAMIPMFRVRSSEYSRGIAVTLPGCPAFRCFCGAGGAAGVLWREGTVGWPTLLFYQRTVARIARPYVVPGRGFLGLGRVCYSPRSRFTGPFGQSLLLYYHL